jgi:outer membrane protein TolC
MNIVFKILLIVLVNSLEITAQNVLKLEAFLDQLSKNHPVANQTDIRIDQSKAEYFAARGAFEPGLMFSNDSKTLFGSKYYNYQNSEIKALTPFGFSLKTGIEQSSGNFIDSEKSSGNLGYLGIEMPILKGLLIDNQRAAVKQAKIFIDLSKEEKRNKINDLYLNAIESYWKWVNSYQMVTFINQNLSNAKERLLLAKITFINGDIAEIDTLEAHLQVQTIELLKNETQMELQNSKIDLSRFLWNDNNLPYYVTDSIVPDVVSFNLIVFNNNTDQLIKNARLSHPEVLMYNYKLKVLEIEQKLKFQSFLPTLNLKANVLSKDYYSFQNDGNAYLSNNYKFGLDFKMPFLLREARGNYKNAQLKIAENYSILDNKIWEIETKINQYGNELNAYANQLKLVDDIQKKLSILLKNEELKFTQGESSMFVINTRENKLIDATIKLQALKLKYLKSAYKQLWAAGELVK